ncbi:WD40/YVTN/BNR-like repeat-containing protein [Flavobacteriaceae bacterium M23B6Z8]
MRPKNTAQNLLQNIVISFTILSICISCAQQEKKNWVDINTLPEVEWERSSEIKNEIVNFTNTATGASVSVLHNMERNGFHFYNGLAHHSQNELAIVGGTGLRVRITANKGQSWTEHRFSGFANPFYAATFNGDTLYTVGESKYIFKTTDLGKSWSVFDTSIFFEEQPLAQFKYYKIKFLNEKLGVLVGEYMSAPILLKTIDGGQNWNKMSFDSDPENEGGITDLHIFSEQRMLIITYMGNVYLTENGGTDWRNLYSSKEDQRIYLNSVAFVDDQIGFIGGIGGMLQTKDGGKIWQKIDVTSFRKSEVNVSDIVIYQNKAYITTSVSFSENEPEAFVYEIDPATDSIRSFLTKKNTEIKFVGESYELEVVGETLYVLDRNNLYKTSLD